MRGPAVSNVSDVNGPRDPSVPGDALHASDGADPGSTHGTITDDGIARLRARIGRGFPARRPWRTEVTRDAIYHLALAIGDLSPLYLDEDYARRARWGTLIGPPIIVNSMDTLRAVGSSGLPEGLPGVHSIWTAHGTNGRVPSASATASPPRAT